MKKINLISLLQLLLASLAGYAQTSPPCDQKINMSTDGVCAMADWNWESLECKNWRAYASQGYLLNMNAPWEKPIGRVALITNQGDYTKAKGWELITRDFGCTRIRPYPFFVLYNRYTGLLRVYIFMSDGRFSSLAVTLRHENSNNHPGTLAHANFPMEAPDQYKFANRDDMVVFVTNDVNVPEKNWTVAEFNTSFDPNTSTYPDLSALVIGMYGVTGSTIRLGNEPIAGPYAFAGSSSSIFGSGSTPTNDGEGSQKRFLAETKKMMETIKLTKELVDKVNSEAKRIQADTKAPEKVKKDAERVEKEATSGEFSKTLGTISGALGVIHPALALLGNVAGYLWADSQSSSFSPSTSISSSKLNGYLETIVVLSPFKVQIPGIPHIQATSTLPYFNCPMGAFALDAKPTIERIDYSRRTGLVEVYDGTYYRNRDDFTPYSSFKISDNQPISYSYNKKAGLELVGVQAALGFKVNSATSKTVLESCSPLSELGLLQKHLHKDKSMYCTGTTVTYINHVLTEVEANRLLVSNYDATNGLHTLQTPYVDISCIRGLALNIPTLNMSTVFVRIKAVFKKAGEGDGATPIIFVQDYGVNENPHPFNENFYDHGINSHPPYTNTAVMPNTYYSNLWLPDGIHPSSLLPNGSLREANYQLTIERSFLRSSSTYTFRAGNKIVLKPGFTAQAGSRILFTTNYGYHVPCTGPTPVINPYNLECGYDTRAYRLASKDEKGLNEATESEISVYPNPAVEGKFTLRFSAMTNATCEVQVFDGLGKRIKPAGMKLVDVNTYEVDLSNGAAGIYLLRINTDSKVITKKVVIGG